MEDTHYRNYNGAKFQQGQNSADIDEARHEALSLPEGCSVLEYWSMSTECKNESLIEDEADFHKAQGEEWSVEERWEREVVTRWED